MVQTFQPYGYFTNNIGNTGKPNREHGQSFARPAMRVIGYPLPKT